MRAPASRAESCWQYRAVFANVYHTVVTDAATLTVVLPGTPSTTEYQSGESPDTEFTVR